MESTRPIRALMRGLDALTVLNLRDGATVSEVAQEIRLPRTTAYRILETLSLAGYVFRDPGDDRYRLTIMVRALSGGFEDAAWVKRIAQPAIEELSRETGWPVFVATLAGAKMVIRESTAHGTAPALGRCIAGVRLPLLRSASGLAYLAFCQASERATLIDLLARSTREEDRPARTGRAELERTLVGIESEGYATMTQSGRNLEELGMSVPAPLAEGSLACVTMRFAASAVPFEVARERFLPKLRQCAAGISGLTA
jgi:IclR family mhp operon transcriptional activator